MSLFDTKPLYSWGSADPPPLQYRWVCIDYPIHVAALSYDLNMYVQNAATGALWMVPGTHYEDPCWRPA